MSLIELTPLLRELSYSDKLLLLHFLVTELLQESNLVPLNDRGEVASQGLHDCFQAAAVLAKALAEEKLATNG
ncbi:MAG: hypothetical protein KME17_30715 [Cyanosarcina radialis HA8281-LM2]|jgi:hypothetical protein|nr:hypothetical protein [Cyanosarcina radialis HA8281-LM2]